MDVTRSGRVYDNPKATKKGKAPATILEDAPVATPIPAKKVTNEEAEAFMKVKKAREYKVVEQMGKSPAHISLLALLLSSKPYREALLKVLTAAQVPKETAPNQIEETVASIFSNNISFFDDQLPSEGYRHSRTLHIVCKCNNFIVDRVMIDNDFALNVCPISTLKQMNVDLNRIRPSKTTVRAFDDSRREVNGEIDLLIDVGPCSFNVTFQVLNIPNAFSLLLGMPWIHSAGAVPSSLHQKLKFFVEDKLITVNGEEDYAIYKLCCDMTTSQAPDLGNMERGSHTLSRWRSTRIGGDSAFTLLATRLFRLAEADTSISLQRTTGGSTGTFRSPSLSHIFPGLPNVVGDALDGPSLNSDDTPDALLTIYDVIEETPSGAYVRPAQDNEGLDNWTSVPRYSAVVGDVSTRIQIIDASIRTLPRSVSKSPNPYTSGKGLTRTVECPRSRRVCTALTIANSLPSSRQKKSTFPPKRQHLRRQRANLLLRIKEEVVKQIDAGFLEVCNYSEWVVNIAPVEKMDGRVRVCVDYRDLTKASLKENFSLPHIDVLVDNTAHHTQLSFINGFSGFNQIRMAEEDKAETTFITMWGTFCYKVMPFGLKNAGATYQPAMVTLFHDMMHKEIEVYVDNMIAKLKEGEDHLVNLKRLFDRLKKYMLRRSARSAPIKGQAIADHLAEFPIEDGTLINSDFPDEGILQVDREEDKPVWKMYFDGAVNFAGSSIGAVLISPDGRYYPAAAKIDFPCTNNVAEYEACILGLQAAIDFKVKESEVFGQYPTFSNRNDRKTLRRLAAHYFLSGETLYRRSFDATLFRCVDENEAQRPMEEVHEGSSGPHMNGIMLPKKIMRLGYFWSTMETDCIKHIRHCHLYQIYANQIKAPPNELHPMVLPWPFSMWGIDVIGPITPKASNGHLFILVAIDYFIKWNEAIMLALVTAKAVARFLKRDNIARYG
ncbi:hypothetical protein CRG98_021642, partial [Punica granatum]